MTDKNYGYYLRASTDKQTDQHQVDDIESFLKERGVDIDGPNVARYADFDKSGSDSTREDFQRLLSDIEDGKLDHLVAWELSRITRDGEDLQKFLNLCEEHETHIHFTADNIDDLPPDGQNRFIADVIGAVYQQERRSLMRRIKAGTKRARSEGKWLGQVPVGFSRDDDGYLQPILSPEHEEGETGFFEVQYALEEIESGASYRSVASETPNVTRQTLSTIMNDPERAAWYTAMRADDERVEGALADVRE